MRSKYFVSVLVLLVLVLEFSIHTTAKADVLPADTVYESGYHAIADSIIHDLNDTITAEVSDSMMHDLVLIHPDSITEPVFVYNVEDANPTFWKQANKFVPQAPDSLFLKCNPLLTALVLKKESINLNWDFDKALAEYSYNNGSPSFLEKYLTNFKSKDYYSILNETRSSVLKKLTYSHPELFAYRYEKLPDTKDLKNNHINSRPLSEIILTQSNKLIKPDSKLNVKKLELNPWTKKVNTLAQFSQNIVSNNWYQGGNSNMAVLGVLTAQLNYDNKKNIQFENNAEWRMGFYYVNDSTALRAINTNNDIIKINSKLGYKINGNWYYSGYIDFSTQLLNNYKAVNSNTLKASFLTPVRFNAGLGLDYKYKKLLSLTLSPLAYKYIYVHEKDPEIVNPNLFGIETGKDHLSEIGSSFKVQTSYTHKKDIQIDSKLTFYTNYQKVEIDWEIIGNFTINRYLSTRLSLNPRYDNTVILAKGEKAHLQFKELLSFGFSYKLLD